MIMCCIWKFGVQDLAIEKKEKKKKRNSPVIMCIIWGFGVQDLAIKLSELGNHRSPTERKSPNIYIHTYIAIYIFFLFQKFVHLMSDFLTPKWTRKKKKNSRWRLTQAKQKVIENAFWQVQHNQLDRQLKHLAIKLRNIP